MCCLNKALWKITAKKQNKKHKKTCCVLDFVYYLAFDIFFFIKILNWAKLLYSNFPKWKIKNEVNLEEGNAKIKYRGDSMWVCMHTHTHTSPWVSPDPQPPTQQIHQALCPLHSAVFCWNPGETPLISCFIHLNYEAQEAETLSLDWKRQMKNFFHKDQGNWKNCLHNWVQTLLYSGVHPCYLGLYSATAFHHGPCFHEYEQPPAEGGMWTFDVKEPTDLLKVTPCWQFMA